MTENVRRIVAQNVKRLREGMRDVSVPAAADTVGVHRSWWNLLENGTLNFTIEKLEKVAAFLGVSVRDLLTEDNVTVFAQSSVTKEKKSSKRRKAS